MGLGGFLAAQSEADVYMPLTPILIFNSITKVRNTAKKEKSLIVQKKKKKNVSKS